MKSKIIFTISIIIMIAGASCIKRTEEKKFLSAASTEVEATNTSERKNKKAKEFLKVIDDSEIGKYVKDIKNTQKNKIYVMGNTSMDLDSTVTSIYTAYYLSKIDSNNAYVPLINMNKDTFKYKLDIIEVLKSINLTLDDLQFYKKNEPETRKFVLVDGHDINQVGGKDNVLKIFDHHPLTKEESKNPDFNNEQYKIDVPRASAISLLLDITNNETYKTVNDQNKYFITSPLIADTLGFTMQNENNSRWSQKDEKLVESILGTSGNLVDSVKNFKEFLSSYKSDINKYTSLKGNDLLKIDSKYGKDKRYYNSSLPFSMGSIFEKFSTFLIDVKVFGESEVDSNTKFVVFKGNENDFGNFSKGLENQGFPKIKEELYTNGEVIASYGFYFKNKENIKRFLEEYPKNNVVENETHPFIESFQSSNNDYSNFLFLTTKGKVSRKIMTIILEKIAPNL